MLIKEYIVTARITTNLSDRKSLPQFGLEPKNEDYGDAVGGKEKEAE